MSLAIATVAPWAGFLSADSAFYGADAAAVEDMRKAAAGVVVAPEALAPIKPIAFAPRIIDVPGRSLALTFCGASRPGVALAATAWEYRLSFDLLHDGLESLWRSLPDDLRPLPLFVVALGYSDTMQRISGLSFLVGGENGPKLSILPPSTHTIQPLPDLPPAVEARWQDAAHGLHVEAFHRDVAEAAARTWPDRIGGQLSCARVDRRGVTMSTLANLGGDRLEDQRLCQKRRLWRF